MMSPHQPQPNQVLDVFIEQYISPKHTCELHEEFANHPLLPCTFCEAKAAIQTLLLEARLDENRANLTICTPDRGIHTNEWLTEYFNIRIAALNPTSDNQPKTEEV